MPVNIDTVFRLADDSVRRFDPNKLNWSWGQALYLYALSLIDTQHGTEKYTDYIGRFYDNKLRTGYRINTSDTSAPALGALYLAQKTGEQRYWAIVKQAREYFDRAPKVVEDMPNHLGYGYEGHFYPKSIWVDSLMMYGVFTGHYAKLTGDAKFV